MAQQQLNSPDVGPGLEQVNREGVPQTVRSCRLGNGATAASFLARLLNGILADVLAWNVAGKQPLFGSCQAPPVSQNLQKSG